MSCNIIQIGDSTAIICGGKPDHVCNSEQAIYILQNGEWVEMTDENFEKYQTQIVGGSVVCSICGRAAINDAPYIDF